MGFPATARQTLTDSTSAQQRDGLLAGSDFLNMFIGSTVRPSVRSRRFPLTRPGIEHRNRLYHDRRNPATTTTHNRYLHSETSEADPRENYTENQEPNHRLSGLIRSQDRHNYNSDANRQFSKTVNGNEQQRGVIRKYSNSASTFREVDAGVVSSDKVINDAMASEARVFGVRTYPRTGSVQMSTSSTSEPAIQAEDSFKYKVSDEVHRISHNEDSSLDNLNISDIKKVKSENNPSDYVFDAPKVEVGNVKNVPESPRFSVSSSVHTVTSKRNHKMPSTQHPVTVPDAFSSTSLVEIDVDTTQRGEVHTSTVRDIDYSSSGNSQSTVDSMLDSTTIAEELSTVTMAADVETTTELNEDWSTKSEEFTSENTRFGDGKRTSDTTQSPADVFTKEETPIQVISVRVSSSVGQSPSRSSQQVNTVSNTILDEPSSIVEPTQHDNDESRETAVNLVTEEQPPATSIQRSDFSVEESSPSEVTADPQLAYSSYYSSKYQSPSTSYYQTSSEKTSSSDPQIAPVIYHPRFTPANSGSRAQFFSKPLRGRRGPLIAQRRTMLDTVGSVEASVVESSRRSYAAHALPRVSAETSGAFKSQSLTKEPVSVAESIQRSVIANQEADDSEARTLTSRGQYHQDKVDVGTSSQRNVEDGKYSDEQRSKIDFNRGRKSFQLDESIQKSYSQPEKMYGEPEKVYGEPARVYGEPSKVYGEPAKIYGEPAKNYGEPSKVYGVPSKMYSEPAKVYGEPSKVYSEPAKVYGEPAKVYGVPSKNYAVPEQNYEVDETVSVMTNGRAHGLQTKPVEVTQPPSQVDTAMKVFDTRQQDPNHKVGYVLEGRDYRKYRVEERTSDGFIVGEYGVVSNDGGNLRGVRYTADGTINPRLIYDTLLKFLSL